MFCLFVCYNIARYFGGAYHSTHSNVSKLSCKTFSHYFLSFIVLTTFMLFLPIVVNFTNHVPQSVNAPVHTVCHKRFHSVSPTEVQPTFLVLSTSSNASIYIYISTTPDAKKSTANLMVKNKKPGWEFTKLL